jgi:aspartyl-tRNA(Asn)/glutamyl-tRNA(Gln) amidotransferase subunit A
VPSLPHDWPFASIERTAQLIRRKEISPVELACATLDRIARLDTRLNAFITVTAERALTDARKAEREILRGAYRGPLHGIPLALKDNVWTRGVRTTAGSQILANFVPTEDATVTRRLARAGAVLLGKTNMHEFAYGVTTENPHYGATRNPWDTRCIAGGSSGGSAAAVAAGMAFGSVGTDTGGSIRIPAALCGIVGLKPTFGRVSRFGVVPLARSLDHAGPLARNVADLAILLHRIAGRDPRDPAACRVPVPDYLRALGRKLGRFRLGWPREYFFEGIDGGVRRALEAAIRVLEGMGAEIKEVTLPHLAEAAQASTDIALAEALRYHQDAGYFPARAREYGEDVRRRLQMGRSVSAASYLRGFEIRRLVRADFRDALQHVDAIVAPTTPVVAPRLHAKTAILAHKKESVRSALVRLNRPANFTGLPSISVPCGFTPQGLPVGLQLIGRPWVENLLLRIAHSYEQGTEWHCRQPELDR